MPNDRPSPNPISLDRRVIFLHIAKTAGTSIVHFFRSRMPEYSICSHGDFLSFPQEKSAFGRRLAEFQFLSGHFGYDDVEELLPGSYSFTFLRDPVDRVLSLYRFCLHADMHRQFAVARAASRLGLEGFLGSTLPEVCEMLDNQQTWQLARNYWQQDRQKLKNLAAGDLLAIAESHLADFSRVGLTENFDTDFRAILDDLDIAEKLPGKKQLKTPNPLTRDQLKPAVLDALEDRLSLDYSLIETVRSQRVFPAPQNAPDNAH